MVLLSLISCADKQSAKVVKPIAWSSSDRWLIADLHSHTAFSDGASSVDELAKTAALAGCDVLAITDHGDQQERAATDEYFAAIDQARANIKRLFIVAGMEWNIPPYAGREHVSILVHPSTERILREFKSAYEHANVNAGEALKWLASQAGSSNKAIAIFNHPSRKADAIEQIERDYLLWSVPNKVMIGFEGAPGHMNAEPMGSYGVKFRTIDHWDPVAADVPGLWDQLLHRGLDTFAALASSDYHNQTRDREPCSFSKIHLQVSERSYDGIFQALRAGTFWSGHGGVLTRLRFTLLADGLVVPAIAGEVVQIGYETPYTISVELERTPEFRDRSLQLELIGDAPSGPPALIKTTTLPPQRSHATWFFERSAPAIASAYFRLRVRQIRPDAPDYLAYTNAIQLQFE